MINNNDKLLGIRNKVNNKLSDFILEISSSTHEYVNLINVNNYIEGVYIIEDFYIGKTTDIYKRILAHLWDSTTQEKLINTGSNLNYEKIFKIKNILNYRKLNIILLNGDVTKENEYISSYYLTHPLTNKTGIDVKIKNTKKEIIKKYRDNCITTVEELMFNMWIGVISITYPITLEITFRGESKFEVLSKIKGYLK